MKNPQQSEFFDLHTRIIALWIMPLFFALSAVSANFSLERHSARAFVMGKIKRLVVPFLVGTFVVLIPVQVYIERLTQGNFQGSFLAFYPHYFDGFYAFGWNFAWMGLHLWYLEMLFLFILHQTIIVVYGFLRVLFGMKAKRKAIL